ncbi:MAG TPA: TonB-dependent receptor [Bryobacteraceae bacterium]|nr:TonB-dependent receptor [Bryobacteraceae bacterium]
MYTLTLFLCMAAVAPAQNVTGTILGTVTDDAGATVPGARVTVTNDGTGQRRELTTDLQGSYVANFLPVGQWSVTVEKDGFRRAALTGIGLQVDQQARIDIALAIGNVTQEITVQASATLLQTENASLGDVIETRQVLTLPLNGRSFLQLATLTPGVTSGGATNGNGLAMNGGRGDFNSYSMDGTSNYSRFDGAVVISPNVDAIQEFRVQTAIPSAEFGFAGNGQINLVTKTGTNAYHGSGYWFLRNRQLDARNFFEPAGPPAAFKRNQYGGTFGGPIRKNRTFFFFDYEGLKVRQSAQARSNIPTRALRSGDFTGERPIFDVLTYNASANSVAQFPGNRIPSQRISKVAAGLNEFYPDPNLAEGAINYVNVTSSKTDGNTYGIRLDHQVNSKHLLFGRYGINDSSSFSPGALPVLGTFNRPRAQLATLNYTWLVSSSAINEIRLGYNRSRANTISARTFNDDIAGRLGVGGVSRDPIDFGFPNISIISNYTAVSDPSNPFPSIRKDNLYQINETMSINRAAHALKFGVQLYQSQLNGVQNSHGRGTFEFDGRFTRNPTAANTTGNEFADYLLGYASRSQRQVGSTQVDMRATLFAGFFQDDWKVSRKLTLNLGVRYELNTPLADKYGRNANVDFIYGSGRAAVVLPGDTGPVTGHKYDNATFRGDYNNWAPRFGFAYRPFTNGKTVVRGGYGIFYSLSVGQTFTFQAQNPPRIVNDVFTAQFPAPALTFENGFELDRLTPSGIVSVRAMEYNRRDPYIQQWDFTLQRQLSNDLVVEAAYVGTKGTKLPRSDIINSPRPGPGAIQPRRPFQGFATFFVREARMTSTYHALQLKADKRFARSHSMLASYTFSKSLDTGSSSFGGGGNSFDNAQDSDNIKAERGRSAQDARQVLTLSYIVELPWLKRNPVIGGWRLAGIAAFRTGFSQSVVVGADRCNCDRAARMRADVVPGAGWKLDNPTTEMFFNTAAFRLPELYTFGNAGRGIVDTPGRQQLDTSLQKDFRGWREGHRIQFRWELFNLLNHTNFNTPNLTIDNRNFGRITGAAAARQMQFGLRYEF